MIDDDLRTLFRERAEQVNAPVPMPGQLRRRVRRRRVLTAMGAAGTAAVLIAGGFVGIRALTEASSRTPADEVTPPPSVPASFPARFVAVTEEGRIRVLDTKSGAVTTEFPDVQIEFAGPGSMALSPDGRFFYFVSADGPAPLLRVPVEGGAAETVAFERGLGPIALSPDGRSVAYSARVQEGGYRLVVENLETGATESWEAGDPEFLIGRLAWLPDSSRLAFTYIHLGDTPHTVMVLDTSQTGVLLKDQPEFRPVSDGPSWQVVGTFGDELAVYEDCCFPDYQERRILLIDAASGGVQQTLIDPADFSATVNAAGDTLIFVRDGTVFGWTPEDGEIRLAEGYVGAVW